MIQSEVTEIKKILTNTETGEKEENPGLTARRKTAKTRKEKR